MVRGGVLGSVGFLALLCFSGTYAEESNVQDLKPDEDISSHSRSGYSLAQAQADAQALNQAFSSPYGGGGHAQGDAPVLSGFGSPYGAGSLSQAQANALASAQGSAQGQGDVLAPSQLSPSTYGEGNSALALPDALAMNQGYGRTHGAEVSADAQANVQTNDRYSPGSSAQASADASALVNAYGPNAQGSAPASVDESFQPRLIPYEEYITPESAPGFEVNIPCTEVGEIYNYHYRGDCLVCVCVKKKWYKKPKAVCTSCLGCRRPSPTPRPTDRPDPFFPDVFPTLPPPPPVPAVTCDPLPNNKPFQNPLNPCQICICRQKYNMYGKPDVQIQCEENPQCVLPYDVTTLPPTPEPPQPVPQPLCDRFPQNVWFPHPNRHCQVCRCSVEVSPYGVPQPSINCYPNPECKPPPLTTARPPPLPPFFPPTEAPFPWPPVTTPAPPPPSPPGPLPGPKPHESCRPYPPNQLFQHPWDSCQVCICSEATAVGLVTVEVNCYTKKECCVEAPGNRLPAPPVIPDYQNPPRALDSVCEVRSLGVEFLYPQDRCKICSCELFGNVIAAVCKRSPARGCSGAPVPNIPVTFVEPKCRNRLPNVPFVTSGAVCICQEVYNYVVAKCTPIPSWSGAGSASANANAQANANAILPYNPLQPSAWNPVGAGSSADATANAHALNLGQYPGLGSVQPGLEQSGASALAEANVVANNNNPWQTGPSQLYPAPSPGWLQPGGGSADSFAQANANANSNDNSNANANAIANANSINNLLPYNNQPSHWGPTGAVASSQAAAEAITNTNSYPYGPFNPGANGFDQSNQLGHTSGHSQAMANAEAQAMANLNHLPYGPSQYLTGNQHLGGAGLYGRNQGGSEPIAANLGQDLSWLNPSAQQPSQLYPGAGAPSSADATASALSSGSGSAAALADAHAQNQQQGYSPFLSNGPGGSSQAQAEALVQANTASYPGQYHGLGPQMQPRYFPGQSGSSSAQANADASAISNGGSSKATASALASASKTAGPRCKYVGDKYHHNCQACFCVRGRGGAIEAWCLGAPCSGSNIRRLD